MLSIHLKKDLDQKLAEFVKKTHMPQEFFVESALKLFFETQKEYLTMLMLVESFQNGPNKNITLEEAEKFLGLDPDELSHPLSLL